MLPALCVWFSGVELYIYITGSADPYSKQAAKVSVQAALWIRCSL